MLQQYTGSAPSSIKKGHLLCLQLEESMEEWDKMGGQKRNRQLCVYLKFSVFFFFYCIIKTSGFRNTAAAIVKIRQGSLVL